MKNIQVLMSTYNGEKYLKDQIDSILNQRDVNIDLLIRDDGSNDHTIDVIKSYKDKRIHLIEGSNYGVTKSFFELIEASNESDYYALCDQDDVWDEDKLIVAVEKLKNVENIPALYSSNTKLVDKDLKLLKIENDEPLTTLGSALVKNYVTGCTVVFNQKLLDLLKRKLNINVPAHDWWINLVALANGGMSIYDTGAHINYRQHGGNVTGASVSIFNKWITRLKRFNATPYHREEMAKILIELYKNNINEDDKKILQDVIELKDHHFSIFKNKCLRTDKLVNNLLFVICVYSNKL